MVTINILDKGKKADTTCRGLSKAFDTLNYNLLLVKINAHGFFSIMMMMINCFCSMLDRRKAFSLISSQGHCQRSSPSRISDTPRGGFETAQNLSSGSAE